MAKRRSISSAIMIASLDPVSLALRAVSGIEILKTPYQAKRSNALNEKQLHGVLHASTEYFNRARPHQGIQQQVPEAEISCVPLDRRNELVIATPILGGLHHDYRRVA